MRSPAMPSSTALEVTSLPVVVLNTSFERDASSGLRVQQYAIRYNVDTPIRLWDAELSALMCTPTPSGRTRIIHNPA